MRIAGSQRGMALVSVLWGIAILSLIASAMLSMSLTASQIDRNGWASARANAIAEGAINREILALMDSRAGRSPRTDGTPLATRFAGSAVTVSVQDESGKIDLNFADTQTLQSLFASTGMDSEDAGRLADRILARRPQADTQTAAGPVAFRTVEDVLGVPGFSRALFARVAPALTVYSRSAQVDRDVAPRQVLLALPGMDADKVDDLLRQRETAPTSNVQPPPSAAASHAFTITAALAIGASRTVRQAVVQFTGDPTKPFWLLAWQ